MLSRYSGGWTKAWIALAVATWALDFFVIVQLAQEAPQANVTMSREDICRSEADRIRAFIEAGDDPYGRCMEQDGAFQSALTVRQRFVVDPFWQLATTLVAVLTTAPLIVAGLFITLKRGFRVARYCWVSVRRRRRPLKFAS